MQGPGGCPFCWEANPLLALWSLAAVPLGELAAASAAGLQALRRPLLLVAQPQDHRLQRLRPANEAALAGANDAPLAGATNRRNSRGKTGVQTDERGWKGS